MTHHGAITNTIIPPSMADGEKRMTATFRKKLKCDFGAEFLEAIGAEDLIVEKNPDVAKQKVGRTYGWCERLTDGKENCFDDIGFEWVGHQKYSMWDCRFNQDNQDGLGRKTIYFTDLNMAKAMALKYSANSITLTESGFSLRWGTRAINNPVHDRKKAGCGATGMGVWINRQINMDIISAHGANGAKLTDALCFAIMKDCGLTPEEQEQYKDGTYEMITKDKAGKLIWKKEIFSGVKPSRIHSSYRVVEEEMKQYKKKKTKKTDMTEEYKAKAKADAKAHGARVEEAPPPPKETPKAEAKRRQAEEKANTKRLAEECHKKMEQDKIESDKRVEEYRIKYEAEEKAKPKKLKMVLKKKPKAEAPKKKKMKFNMTKFK